MRNFKLTYYNFLCLILIVKCSIIHANYKWMDSAIIDDCSHFLENPYDSTKLEEALYSYPHQYLVLVEVKNNNISYKYPDTCKQFESNRLKFLKNALYDITQISSLPDCTFLVTMHDIYSINNARKEDHPLFDLPVFTSSKWNDIPTSIMIPDFYALNNMYKSMFPENDPAINATPINFSDRKNQLIFRGCPYYHHYHASTSYHEMFKNRRLLLARLSLEHPDLIDAGFTRSLIAPSYEIMHKVFKDPLVQAFLFTCVKDDISSFSNTYHYKYQILIDGIACSFSASGWRFFSESCVFKNESIIKQWYYNQMIAWVHYVPIKDDLSDLVDNILYLNDHQDLAEEIAKNGKQFAVNHISRESSLVYLEKLIKYYAKLPKS